MRPTANIVFVTVIVFMAAAIAAGVSVVLSERKSLLAFVSWVIFFAALESPFVFHVLRTGELDSCSARLARLLRLPI